MTLQPTETPWLDVLPCDPTMTDLAKTLRRLRAGRGWSQSSLARLSGVSQKTISEIERSVARTPYRTTVAKLEAALGAGDVLQTVMEAEAMRGLPGATREEMIVDERIGHLLEIAERVDLAVPELVEALRAQRAPTSVNVDLAHLPPAWRRTVEDLVSHLREAAVLLARRDEGTPT